MNSIHKIIEEAVDTSGENNQKNEADYEKDGLVYCGKCHTQKQHLVRFPWGDRKPWVNCQCEQEKADEIARQKKEKLHRERVADLQKDCIRLVADELRKIKGYNIDSNWI